MLKKSFLKRSLALVLALLLVTPLLIACNAPDDPQDPGVVETPVSLVSGGKSDYVIIYPNDNDIEQNASATLREAVKAATGVALKRYNDASRTPSDEAVTEILVGATNRTESQSAIAALRAKDYSITYANGRVVIAGGSEEATAAAVTHFINTYIDSTAKTVTVYQKRNDLHPYAYPLGALSISGTPITDYVIVYPSGADLITKYMAVNLSDYILTNAGVEVKVVTDATAAQECELLVGKTNRTESNAADGITLSDNQFVLVQSGKKVAMLGNSYMVGGAVSELVNVYFASQGVNTAINATTIPTAASAKAFSFKTATSAILMIGDGMGLNHIELTERAGEIDKFVAEYLPYQSTCTTISQTVIDEAQDSDPTTSTRYTDSAAAATALATGYKTLNKYLGMDAQGHVVQNVRELADSTGAKTAVITTDVITGATPSGFLCHHTSRHDTAILEGQIEDLQEAGSVEYLYGGGGLTSELLDPTREGLSKISEVNGNFFAMIEEAYIDKRAHYGDDAAVQDCVARYNETIAYVIGFVMLHPYTALIVTADHETGELTYNEGSQKWEFIYDAPYDHDGTYYEHTDLEVPVFGLGAGLDNLFNNPDFDNTDIPKFIATIFGNNNFGG